jgi:predicted 2-oxoglutarate/Fe(II)-dependent dioxygenase YbiX
MAESGSFYIEPQFFDRITCGRIVRAMEQGTVEEAEILDDRIEPRQEIRRAASIEVAPAVIDEVEAALEARRDVLARFFGMRLREREGVGFLRYPTGGFYKPHVDRAHVDAWPAAACRALAVVAFLNGSRQAERDGSFDGGVLRLFPNGEPIEVPPRAGQLVAFRADMLHEVTEVRNGIRDAIVDWFYA